MSIFSHKQPVDLDQLDQDVTTHLHRLNAEANANARVPQERHYTPLQTIGYEITRLTWTEAEEMGKSIAAKMKNASEMHDLTSAIQEWASEWEKFTDVQA